MQHTIESAPQKLHKPVREDDALRREVLVTYATECTTGGGGTTTGDPGGGDPGGGDGDGSLTFP